MRTEITPLMPDDVAALRQANGVVFTADSEGRAKVKAILERRDPANFTPVEARIFPIPNEYDNRERDRVFRVDGYARATGGLMGWESPLNGRRLVGHYYAMAAHHYPAWRTIARLIKPGNGIELMFLADHSTNENLRKANFHADDFFLRIWTPVKDREGYFEPTHEFQVDVGVGPHDSARMVRAEGDASQCMSTVNIDDFWKEAA